MMEKKIRIVKKLAEKSATTFNDYPESAKNNAKKAIKWKKEHGDEVKGGTRVGWTRAGQLARGEKISKSTIRRMASFNRHRKNSKVDPKFKDTPWKDRGYVAWLIWGGTSGVNWAIRKSESFDRAKKDYDKDCVSKKISIVKDENPDWEHKQVVAVAINMCKDKKSLRTEITKKDIDERTKKNKYGHYDFEQIIQDFGDWEWGDDYEVAEYEDVPLDKISVNPDFEINSSDLKKRNDRVRPMVIVRFLASKNKMKPLVTDMNYNLLDGHHRMYCCKKKKQDKIRIVKVKPKEKEEDKVEKIYKKLGITMKEEKEYPCPPATQDLELNTKNRDKTIEKYNYGALNPDNPGDYWKEIAVFWNTTEENAKKSLCGNCVAFDVSPRMKDCLPGDTFDDDGELGYCWMHHFKCHSARTCHTWAKGGAIEKDEESYEWQDKANFDGKSAKASPCWDGYKQVGMKRNKKGNLVPNCVPVKKEANDPSTPAKPSERIRGSDDNRSGSASGQRGGIKLTKQQIKGIKTIVDKHNEKVKEKNMADWKKVNMGQAKAVVRRGMGAFSVSHRPNVSSRTQWGLGRLNAFIHLLEKGKPKNSKYVGDNDLLPKEHKKSTKKKNKKAYDELRDIIKKEVTPINQRTTESLRSSYSKTKNEELKQLIATELNKRKKTKNETNELKKPLQIKLQFDARGLDPSSDEFNMLRPKLINNFTEEQQQSPMFMGNFKKLLQNQMPWSFTKDGQFIMPEDMSDKERTRVKEQEVVKRGGDYSIESYYEETPKERRGIENVLKNKKMNKRFRESLEEQLQGNVDKDIIDKFISFTDGEYPTIRFPVLYIPKGTGLREYLKAFRDRLFSEEDLLMEEFENLHSEENEYEYDQNDELHDEIDALLARFETSSSKKNKKNKKKPQTQRQDTRRENEYEIDPNDPLHDEIDALLASYETSSSKKNKKNKKTYDELRDIVKKETQKKKLYELNDIIKKERKPIKERTTSSLRSSYGKVKNEQLKMEIGAELRARKKRDSIDRRGGETSENFFEKNEEQLLSTYKSKVKKGKVYLKKLNYKYENIRLDLRYLESDRHEYLQNTNYPFGKEGKKQYDPTNAEDLDEFEALYKKMKEPEFNRLTKEKEDLADEIYLFANSQILFERIDTLDKALLFRFLQELKFQKDLDSPIGRKILDDIKNNEKSLASRAYKILLKKEIGLNGSTYGTYNNNKFKPIKPLKDLKEENVRKLFDEEYEWCNERLGMKFDKPKLIFDDVNRGDLGNYDMRFGYYKPMENTIIIQNDQVRMTKFMIEKQVKKMKEILEEYENQEDDDEDEILVEHLELDEFKGYISPEQFQEYLKELEDILKQDMNEKQAQEILYKQIGGKTIGKNYDLKETLSGTIRHELAHHFDMQSKDNGLLKKITKFADITNKLNKKISSTKDEKEKKKLKSEWKKNIIKYEIVSGALHSNAQMSNISGGHDVSWEDTMEILFEERPKHGYSDGITGVNGYTFIKTFQEKLLDSIRDSEDKE